MRSTNEWAKVISGEYGAWIREPGGSWEDLIGKAKVACEVRLDGQVELTIDSIEFGRWSGSLSPEDRTLRGSTGQVDTSFELRFQEADQTLRGGVHGPAGDLLFELLLRRDQKHDDDPS